jgi:hypothetical protein
MKLGHILAEGITKVLAIKAFISIRGSFMIPDCYQIFLA